MPRSADEPTFSQVNPLDPDATLLPDNPSVPAAAASAQVHAPTGYVIERELGRGGMGVVYLARHLKLDRPCALKMILSGAHADSAEADRFRTEAQAIARLQHPGIVQVFEIGEHDGRPFMALEFCPGGSLDGRLRDKPPKAPEAARLVRALALAVQAAHEAHVLHRDLKPANVLIAGDGTLKITDFGLARKLDEEGQTRTGMVVGTPSYMPPEQARGDRKLGPSVDVYALGAILYACLTGRPPFRGATMMETLRQVLDREPVAVRELNPGVPRDLETICLKCLRKDPRQRYASAQELADDLGRFLNGEPIRGRPVGALERGWRWCRRNPVVASLTAAVFLVLTAGVIASWTLTAWAMSETHRAENETGIAKQATATANKEAGEATRQKGIAETKTAEADREKENATRNLTQAELALYASKLAQAQREFELGNGGAALAILESCQWNLRNIEFRYLWSRFNSKLTFRASTSNVNCVAASPDGRHIVSDGEGNTLKIWDVETGREVRTLKGHTWVPSCVAYSPDGKYIASGSKETKIWDAETGREVRTLEGHARGVGCLAFTPDGQWLVSSGNDPSPKVWDVATGEELFRLEGHSSVSTFAYSRDGKRIVTGSGDRTVTVWDAATGAELFSALGHTVGVSGVAFSPDGSAIVSAGPDGSLTLWSVSPLQAMFTFKVGFKSAWGAQFSPDGTHIVCIADGALRFFDPRTGQELFALKGHAQEVTGLAFSPDGRRIYSSSRDGTVKAWDAQRSQDFRILGTGVHPVQGVRCVALSPDGTRIAGGGMLRVWDVDSGAEVLSFKGREKEIGAVAFSPDGKQLASVGADTVRVWEATTGQEIRAWPAPGAGSGTLTFSPDGKRLLLGRDGQVKLWDIGTEKEIFSFSGQRGGYVGGVAISPDGKQIAAATFRSVKIWDAVTGQELPFPTGQTDPVGSLAYSPDGKRLVGSASNGLTVWDLDRGQVILTLRGHGAGTGVKVAYSSDGKRIISGGTDQMIKFWDAESGLELLSLRHPGPVGALSLTPDGKRLATTGWGANPVKLWDMDRTQDVHILPAGFWGVRRVVYSPDGKRLAGEDQGGGTAIWLWDTEKGRDLALLQGHTDRLAGFDFSPDGKYLLSTGRDKVVNLWDVEKGTIIFSHKVDTADMIPPVPGFSPDGKRAFALVGPGRFRAWSVPGGEPVEPSDPPRSFQGGTEQLVARSPDGFFRAESRRPGVPLPDGWFRGEPGRVGVAVIDTRVPVTESTWPLPDLAERLRFRREQADRAERMGPLIASGFQLEFLLADAPWDAVAHLRLSRLYALHGNTNGAALHLLRGLLIDPAARLDRVWAYEGGTFESQGDGTWIEKARDGLHRFQERDRTPQYVELHDKERGYTIRLTINSAFFQERPGQDFGLLYNGGWVR
jgi:WD40 repeat protein